MKSILENRPALTNEVNKAAEVAGYLWQKGWAERNGGNIVVNITEFVDDEIALDPKTGVLEKETCASTRQVLANLLAIVRAGGGDLESIARVDIALTDAVDISVFNDEYAHFFGTHKPARFTYFVKALPAGATMELSVAAFI